MDPRTQFTLKSASVLRRVRGYPLRDEHVWGDTEPVTYYQEPAHHSRSNAAKHARAEASVHRVTAAPSAPEASAPSLLP